jgi:hypothetical protein
VAKPYDPNDMSIALILEWGEFRYFTAGDLSGDASKTSYYDVEPGLVKYLQGADMPLNGGKIKVLKVTHHGSEHSNYPKRDGQLSFLDALQPEVLIHPSNQSKQVPSAIFLQQAYEYIEAANGRKIFFVNRMDYKQNKGRDKDRYEPLKKFIEQAVTNIRVEVGKDVIRNDDTFAIIVRYSSDVLNDPMLEGNDQQIKKDTYDIIIKKGTIPGVDDYKGRTYKTDIWNVPLEAEQYEKVINELEKFASVIVGWLKEDQERATSTGIDYINQYYPSLNPKNEDPDAKGLKAWNLVNGGGQPLELESQLVNKMKNLMEGLFTKNKNNIYAVTGSELNEQEEITIDKLLYLNYHQEALNTKLYPRESFWNIQGEPYVEPGNPKKRKGVFESIRAKKVPKKLED